MRDSANSNISKALSRALGSLLSELKRFYGSFIDPEQFSASGGRPYAYSISEAASRLQCLMQAAQGYISDEELSVLKQQFHDDLHGATQLGGDLAEQLRQLVAKATNGSSGSLNWAAVLSAADSATAYIEDVPIGLRVEVAQALIYAIALGHGHKKVCKEIEVLLIKHANPDSKETKREINQRAELIAGSELANAYVEAQLRTSKESGFNYVQWIATKDERACPLCVSRHGNIYKIGEVTGNAHPLCRCSLCPVMDEAVEEQDKEVRDVLLDSDYWRKSQAQARKELQQAKGWDEARLDAELKKALQEPTPYEKSRNTGATEAVRPVIQL